VIRHHSSGYCRGFVPRSLFIAMIKFFIATPIHNKSKIFSRIGKKQISTGVNKTAGQAIPGSYY